jgi:hypothetical protein
VVVADVHRHLHVVKEVDTEAQGRPAILVNISPCRPAPSAINIAKVLRARSGDSGEARG